MPFIRRKSAHIIMPVLGMTMTGQLSQFMRPSCSFHSGELGTAFRSQIARKKLRAELRKNDSDSSQEASRSNRSNDASAFR